MSCRNCKLTKASDLDCAECYDGRGGKSNLSNCCSAPITNWPDSDICSDYLEHCEPGGSE